MANTQPNGQHSAERPTRWVSPMTFSPSPCWVESHGHQARDHPGGRGVDGRYRRNRDEAQHVRRRNRTVGRAPVERLVGDNPPYHHPVFVLTHHPREPVVCEGGTTFTFVTDGIASALDQAKAAAAGKDV